MTHTARASSHWPLVSAPLVSFRVAEAVGNGPLLCILLFFLVLRSFLKHEKMAQSCSTVSHSCCALPIPSLFPFSYLSPVLFSCFVLFVFGKWENASGPFSFNSCKGRRHGYDFFGVFLFFCYFILFLLLLLLFINIPVNIIISRTKGSICVMQSLTYFQALDIPSDSLQGKPHSAG